MANNIQIEEMSKEQLIEQINELQSKLERYQAIGTPERLSCEHIELQEYRTFDDYNYRDEVYNDVLRWMEEENERLFPQNYDSAADLVDAIHEELWTSDSVTGNGSGSYWFNSYKAASALAHNYDLLKEAMDEFGNELTTDKLEDYEANDITIRCYLLRDAIDKVVEDLYDDEQYSLDGFEPCYNNYRNRQESRYNKREFAERFRGCFESLEDASMELGVPQEGLDNEYDIFFYPGGVYLLKQIPKNIRL